MKPLSVPQAAERLNLSPAMVRRHCQLGNLKAVKVGGTWVIDEADLEAFAKVPRRRGPKVTEEETLDIAIKNIALGTAVDPRW